jgi:hypothetical protein
MQDITSTEINLRIIKAYEPVQRAAEAIIEPILERLYEICIREGLLVGRNTR